MFRYYFRLGIRSLKRNMVLTGLMIAAVGSAAGIARRFHSPRAGDARGMTGQV